MVMMLKMTTTMMMMGEKRAGTGEEASGREAGQTDIVLQRWSAAGGGRSAQVEKEQPSTIEPSVVVPRLRLPGPWTTVGAGGLQAVDILLYQKGEDQRGRQSSVRCVLGRLRAHAPRLAGQMLEGLWRGEAANGASEALRRSRSRRSPRASKIARRSPNPSTNGCFA